MPTPRPLLSYILLIALVLNFVTAKAQNDRIQPIWEFRTGGPVFSTPLHHEGKLFIGSVDSTVYCIDAKGGQRIWSYRTKGEIRSNAAIAGDILVVNSGDGNVYALSLKNGTPSWVTPTLKDRRKDYGDYFMSSPLIVGNNIYVGADSCLFALDALTGKVRWQRSTNGPIHSTPVILNGDIYIGSFDGQVYRLDPATGSIKNSFRSIGQQFFPKGEFQGEPVVQGNRLFIASRDYNVYGLAASLANADWNHRFQAGWGLGLTTIRDSVIYISTSDDRSLFAFSQRSGRMFWRSETGFNLFAPLLITGPLTGVIGDLRGRLFKIDLKTGSSELLFHTKGDIQNAPSYFDERSNWQRQMIDRFIKDPNEYLSALYKLGAFFRQPAIAGDRLFIASTDGTVYAFPLPK